MRKLFIGRLKHCSPSFISERIGGVIKKESKTHVSVTDIVRYVEVSYPTTKEQLQLLREQLSTQKGVDIDEALNRAKEFGFSIVVEQINEQVFSELEFEKTDFQGYSIMTEKENPQFFAQLDNAKTHQRLQKAGIQQASSIPENASNVQNMSNDLKNGQPVGRV